MTDKFCECCGAKLVKYKHSLSKSLLRCLYIPSALGYKSFNPGELDMNYNQRANFQKLQYWGLVERCDQDKAKGGDWRITEKGWFFLRGEIKVHKIAWTFRGKLERYDGEEVSVMEVTGGWRYRPDYARERAPL